MYFSKTATSPHPPGTVSKEETFSRRFGAFAWYPTKRSQHQEDMFMKSTTAIALLLAAAITTAATDEPIERPPPDPIDGEHSHEIFTYTGFDENGDRVPLGRTIKTHDPDRETFEAEVAETREELQTIHSHISEMIVIDEFPDRPTTVRRVHPGDEAGRRERDDDQSDPE